MTAHKFSYLINFFSPRIPFKSAGDSEKLNKQVRSETERNSVHMPPPRPVDLDVTARAAFIAANEEIYRESPLTFRIVH